MDIKIQICKIIIILQTNIVKIINDFGFGVVERWIHSELQWRRYIHSFLNLKLSLPAEISNLLLADIDWQLLHIW